MCGRLVSCLVRPAYLTSAVYRPADQTITFNSSDRFEGLEALATTQAHDLWHVGTVGDDFYPRTAEGCFQNEIDANTVSARVWAQFGPPSPRTDYESHHHSNYRCWIDGSLEFHVRRLYQEQCAA